MVSKKEGGSEGAGADRIEEVRILPVGILTVRGSGVSGTGGSVGSGAKISRRSFRLRMKAVSDESCPRDEVRGGGERGRGAKLDETRGGGERL